MQKWNKNWHFLYFKIEKQVRAYMLEVYKPCKNNHKITTVAHKRTYKTDFQTKVSKNEKSA